MAYNENLAERVRQIVIEQASMVEKKMFGGLGFILDGNMACGIIGDDLIVRVGTEGYEQALQKPGANPFGMSATPMKGWVAVSPEGTQSAEGLHGWVQQGVNFAQSLPSKSR